jgi:hypothetical protein
MPLLTPPDLEIYAPSIPIADRTTVAIALAAGGAIWARISDKSVHQKLCQNFLKKNLP